MSGQQHLSEQLIFVNSTCPAPDAHIKQLFTCDGKAVTQGSASAQETQNGHHHQIQMQEAQAAPSSSQQAACPTEKKEIFFNTLQQQKHMAKANVFLKNGQARLACKISLTSRCVFHLESGQ